MTSLGSIAITCRSDGSYRPAARADVEDGAGGAQRGVDLRSKARILKPGTGIALSECVLARHGPLTRSRD
jgi:hypothetical protein